MDNNNSSITKLGETLNLSLNKLNLELKLEETVNLQLDKIINGLYRVINTKLQHNEIYVCVIAKIYALRYITIIKKTEQIEKITKNLKKIHKGDIHNYIIDTDTDAKKDAVKRGYVSDYINLVYICKTCYYIAHKYLLDSCKEYYITLTDYASTVGVNRNILIKNEITIATSLNYDFYPGQPQIFK